MDKPCINANGALNNSGYVYRTNYWRGERAEHRIAWMKVNGYIPKGMQIRHLCHNKACIEITHLAIGSDAENKMDSVKAGRALHVKLTKEEVLEIRKEAKFETYTALAKKYKVSPSAIRSIVIRRNWKWLD